MPSIQRVHNMYKSMMNSHDHQFDSSFRRAESLERSGKKDFSSKDSKTLFKQILTQKMEEAGKR